jgi:hypothetical protein
MIQPRGTTQPSRPRGPARAARITEDQLHELRNHIHGIVMAVQLALDVEAEKPAARQRRNLHMIEERCRQLAAFARLLRPAEALPKARRHS